MDFIILLKCTRKESLRHKEQSDEETFKDLFQFIEQSFGRPLSPIEIDTLNQWIDVDNHDISVIQAAVNEALSQEKINFKYIDRILLNWKRIMSKQSMIPKKSANNIIRHK